MGKHPQGNFSFSVVNDKNSDSIYFTVGVPKILDVPYVGPTSIETLSFAAATCLVPCTFWYVRRTIKRIQQYNIARREEKERLEKSKEPPVKAKNWEVKNGKLEKFIDSEIIPTKQRLRKVEDPDTVAKRQAKREKIKQEQSKKGKGPLALSDDLLQNKRTGLRQTEKPKGYLDNDRDNEDHTINEDIDKLATSLEKDIKTYQLNGNGREVKEPKKSHIIS